MGELRVKRIYEPAAPDDGARVLVDRIWPRGITKKDAALAWWDREIAPSPKLRKWFGHDPERWADFQDRYMTELQANKEAAERLRAALDAGPVTLLYGARDQEHNHAIVLARFLREAA